MPTSGFIFRIIFHLFLTCSFNCFGISNVHSIEIKMVKSSFFIICYIAACISNIFASILLHASDQNVTNYYDSQSKTRCEIPKAAPKNIENAIVECQVEIQIALLSDAIELAGTTKSESQRDLQSTNERNRKVRSTDTFFTEEERKIAGCLLQCVYRKMKAVNEFGFPRPDGLVTLYTEGVTDPEYIKGTFRAVNSCLANAKKTYATTLESVKDDGTTCDVAFYTFDCISDLIDEYCKQNP